MRRRNKFIVAILLIAALTLLLCACNDKGKQEETGIIKTPLTAVCAGSTTKTVQNSLVKVTYCDCNVLGNILNGGGKTTNLAHNTIADVPSSVFEKADAFSEKFSEFFGDYELPTDVKRETVEEGSGRYDDFAAVLSAAQDLFSESDFNVCKKVKYNLNKSAVIGLNKTICMSTGSDLSYNQMRLLAAELFGYNNVTTFQTYANNLVSYLHSLIEASGDNEPSRLALDGGFYTKNGSFVLPYAVTSDLSSNFVAVLVFDSRDVLSLWVSSIDSLAYAVDLEEENKSATNVYVYGRCNLFDRQSGFYHFTLVGDLPACEYATIKISTSDGLSKTITVLLLKEYAPTTVENFIAYAQQGFYDGTIIHRIVSGGCLQGGGYVEQGTPIVRTATREAIKGEFASNGYMNNVIGHCPGTISMARTDEKDSATSGFFLCYNYYPSWDGDYAAFGFMPYQEDIDFVAMLGNSTVTGTKKLSSSVQLENYPTSRKITIEEVKTFGIDVPENAEPNE